MLCNANRLKFETRPRDTKDALDNVVLALATALRDSGAHDVPRFGGPHLYRTCSSSRTAEQFGDLGGLLRITRVISLLKLRASRADRS